MDTFDHADGGIPGGDAGIGCTEFRLKSDRTPLALAHGRGTLKVPVFKPAR